MGKCQIWSATRHLKMLIVNDFFFLELNDDNNILYSFRTGKYIAKSEVEIFLRVIVPMVTV